MPPATIGRTVGAAVTPGFPALMPFKPTFVGTATVFPMWSAVLPTGATLFLPLATGVGLPWPSFIAATSPPAHVVPVLPKLCWSAESSAAQHILLIHK